MYLLGGTDRSHFQTNPGQPLPFLHRSAAHCSATGQESAAVAVTAAAAAAAQPVPRVVGVSQVLRPRPRLHRKKEAFSEKVQVANGTGINQLRRHLSPKNCHPTTVLRLHPTCESWAVLLILLLLLRFFLLNCRKSTSLSLGNFLKRPGRLSTTLGAGRGFSIGNPVRRDDCFKNIG